MGLREEQLCDIQRLWGHYRSTMASLVAEERNLRDMMRSQLESTGALDDCEGLYLPLMDTGVWLPCHHPLYSFS